MQQAIPSGKVVGSGDTRPLIRLPSASEELLKAIIRPWRILPVECSTPSQVSHLPHRYRKIIDAKEASKSRYDSFIKRQEELDEAIVVGYGVQKKHLPWHPSLLPREDLLSGNLTSVSEAWLQGKLNGVVAINSTVPECPERMPQPSLSG